MAPPGPRPLLAKLQDFKATRKGVSPFMPGNLVRPLAAAAVSNSRMRLGINMIEIDYWTQSSVLNNLVYGEVNKYTSGAFSGALTDVPEVNLDAQRWPKTLPNAGAYIVRILSNPTSTGIFNITWQGNISDMFLSSGPATLSSIDYVNRTAVLTVTDVLPSAVSPIILKYTFTDTVNYPKNIDIRQSGASGRFNAKFLADLAKFRGPIRVVKWNKEAEGNLISGNQTAWAGGTSSSPTRLILWANRNLPTGGDWKSYDGVPIEVIVELANTVNKDVHINIPWNADDAYVTGIATIVKNNLNPGLVARFEVSNEVWNAGYPVYFQASAEGLALGNEARAGSYLIGGHAGLGDAYCRLAQRSYEIHSLITTVFAGQLSRIMRLICFQHANAWASGELFTWVAALHPTWLAVIDGMATAPYFSSDLPVSYTGDPQAVFDDVRRYIDTFLTPNAITHTNTAATYGLYYTTYEAGASLLFSNQSYQRRVHTDIRMYWIHRYYLEWMQQFWTSAITFSWTHPIDAVNAWGLKEYEGQPITIQDTPKFAAVDWYMDSGNYASALPTGILQGTLKVWNGASWTPKNMKVWDGAAFVYKQLKLWAGSSWIAVSSIPPSSTVAFTTTNGADKSSSITLSNSNLTATGSASPDAFQGVRADTAKAGKRQFEVTLDNLSPFGPATYIGVDNSSTSFASNGTTEATPTITTGVVFTVQGNGVYKGFVNGTQPVGGSMSGGFASGDIITFTYDDTAGNVATYRTRSGTTVLIDNSITGVSLASWRAFVGVDSDNAVTANFGASAFARALDAGYSSYQ